MSEYYTEPQQISYRKEELHEVSKYIATLKESEDVVLFLGHTKSGRSTLINYLLGNKLEAQFNIRLFITSIRRVSEQDTGPRIGVGIESETSVPSRWEDSPYLPDLVLYDTRGFGDNRGVIQVVINACFIYQIFQIAKSLKIVLVLDFSEFVTTRMNSFLSLLRNVEELLLSAMRSCYASIAIVINKAPKMFYNKRVNVALICDLLKGRILENPFIRISQVCRNFVKHLVENKHQISLFNEVEPGPFPVDIGKNVVQSILSTKSVRADSVKKFVRPNLDDESRLLLLEALENVVPLTYFKDFCTFVNQICHEKLVPYSRLMDNDSSESTMTEMVKLLIILSNNISKILEKDQSLDQLIISLINNYYNIDGQIQDEIEQKDLLIKMKLVELIDQLLDTEYCKLYRLMMQIVNNDIFWKVEKLKITVDEKLNKITEAEFNMKMEKLNSEEQEQVERWKSEFRDVDSRIQKVIKESNEKCSGSRCIIH